MSQGCPFQLAFYIRSIVLQGSQVIMAAVSDGIWSYNVQLYDQYLQTMELIPTKTALMLLLLLVSLLACAFAQPKQITSQNLNNWAYIPDGVHRFIIINQQLLAGITPLLPVTSGVEYYTHDCQKNSTLLHTCSKIAHVPLIVIYNKVPIQYEYWVEGLSTNQHVADVLEWMHRIVTGKSRKDVNEEEILKILEDKKEIFILVENSTIKELEMGYNILAKQFAYKDFIYLANPQIYHSLGLSIGQFVHIKSLQQNLHGLGSYLGNQSLATKFPKQAQALKYSYMKMFVMENIYARGFAKHMDSIDKQRFQIQVRKQNGEGGFDGKRIVIIFCDLGEQCRQFWAKLDSEILNDASNLKDTVINRIFKRADSMNNIELIQIYFHAKLRDKKLPFMLVIDGEDPSVSNLPVRYVKQLSMASQNPYVEVKEFLTQADAGKLSNIQLKSGVPKKNGFTGKGSQKFVQKLTYETYKQTLQQAKTRKKHYLLFVTAFEYNCPQCLSFYNEYRKLASFLNAEQFQDVVLGVYDLSKDQIDLQYLRNVPSVFLFSPYEMRPIEYQKRYEFEDLMRFVKEEVAKAKHKQERANNKENVNAREEEL